MPIADQGKPDSFDTRERMGEQLLRPCRALAQTQTHALESATSSSIGFSDHDSSHASQGTWLRPRSPKTGASDFGREAKQHSTEVSSSALPVAEPTFFDHLPVSALAQSPLFTLMFIVDPPGDLGDLRPTLHIRWNKMYRSS